MSRSRKPTTDEMRAWFAGLWLVYADTVALLAQAFELFNEQLDETALNERARELATRSHQLQEQFTAHMEEAERWTFGPPQTPSQ